ncbi:hypothetical protein DFH06DRAFT_1468488 [Mycena polygramma]|nr:hypothetical protein DFH06DRAFT_1468488 [Mycena polygramma]
MSFSTPQELHPGLRLQSLSRVPVSLRKIANAAAHGSLESLRRLLKFMQEPQIDLYLPVIYANLDPSAIPTSLIVETPFSLDENALSAITAAFLSLLTLSDMKLGLSTRAVVPQLWPRCWNWIQFLDMHYYCVSLSDTRGSEDNRTAYFRVFEDFYHHPEVRLAINTTPGADPSSIAGLLTMSGFLIGHEVHGFRSKDGPITEPHHISHIEELAEGASGMDQLAQLIVDHINLRPTDPSHRRDSLVGALVFIRHTKLRGLFLPGYFWSAGIARALIEAVLAIAAIDMEHLTNLLEMCFDTIRWAIQGNMHHLQTAIRHGLLDAIALCCKADRDVETMREILNRDLSNCTQCEWRSFLDLVDERGVFLNLFDSVDYTISRACDNLEDKARFQRCGGCLQTYYCGEACQRADWRVGGHREACGLKADNRAMRTRDRDFLRALLHRDYLQEKPSILAFQVEFLVTRPGEQCYVLFDYTCGRPDIRVSPCAGVSGPRSIEMNAYNRRQLARAAQSDGRLILHRAHISFGGPADMYWFPLRTQPGMAELMVSLAAKKVQETLDVADVTQLLREHLANFMEGAETH